MVYNFREFIFILTAVNVVQLTKVPTRPFPTDPDWLDMSENGWNIMVGKCWNMVGKGRNMVGKGSEFVRILSHKKQISFVFYPT